MTFSEPSVLSSAFCSSVSSMYSSLFHPSATVCIFVPLMYHSLGASSCPTVMYTVPGMSPSRVNERRMYMSAIISDTAQRYDVWPL